MSSVISHANGVDIFGDIHGHIKPVEALLRAVGYEKLDGVWRHPKGRKALFIGDLIDRGPANRQVVSLVRNMVENHEAVCLMGNHEFNAVTFATPRPDERDIHLRPRIDKNIKQHIHYLFEHYSEKDGAGSHRSDIEWFKTLPLWVDVDGFRAIHACWSPDDIQVLQNNPNCHLNEGAEFWIKATDKSHSYYAAIENILKGAETRLPEGFSFKDKDENIRTMARLQWWNSAKSWGESVQLKSEDLDRLADYPFSIEGGLSYSRADKPVFFGHYWESPRNGRPFITREPNAACLDFSVARSGGLLGLYQWDGEGQLSSSKLIASDQAGVVVRPEDGS